MTNHSSFVNVSYVACVTVDRNFTVHNTLLTCSVLKVASNACREVDEVREGGLDKEENERERN